MDCGMPSFSVLHYLLELAQTCVLWVSDAIQPSHPLSLPSPPALNLFMHKGLFQWVSSLHQVAKILELQLQHLSVQWIFRIDFLWGWLVWSPYSPRDSLESSPAPQFESIIGLGVHKNSAGGFASQVSVWWPLLLANPVTTYLQGSYSGIWFKSKLFLKLLHVTYSIICN